MGANTLALYTTVYPGCEPYLRDWHDSVAAQTDRGFDLWIGTDGLPPEAVAQAAGVAPGATWVVNDEGGSPAGLREKAIRRLVERYEGVVFADSDDVLHPSRVAAARVALRQCDVVGCALRLVGAVGADLGLVFGPARDADLRAEVVRTNAFGLGNTAYRSVLLRHCLPLPEGCLLRDWFLITRSVALGARLMFDFTPRGDYRQHEANASGVLPPRSAGQLRRAAELVLGHYAAVLAHVPELPRELHGRITAARTDVEAFLAGVASPPVAERYLTAVAEVSGPLVWWDYVARPDLKPLWNVVQN